MTKKVTLFLVCALTSGCNAANRPEETITVVGLHGDDVEIPVSKMDKITPLGWAMTLDLHPTARNIELFKQACQHNPKLADEVDHLFRSKATVDAAMRRHRGRFGR
jgi:hypothetical protein